ncbi:hypothetical protein XAR_1959 [Xanthomonas citri pv. glycines str. 8ra]|nr:hypothetical protein XAR_1959 [Xanthomonas citri pv. glycines str. 8ra]
MPPTLAHQIKEPVFLAAGGKDERAPAEHTKRKRALKDAGVPVDRCTPQRGQPVLHRAASMRVRHALADVLESTVGGSTAK